MKTNGTNIKLNSIVVHIYVLIIAPHSFIFLFVCFYFVFYKKKSLAWWIL